MSIKATLNRAEKHLIKVKDTAKAVFEIPHIRDKDKRNEFMDSVVKENNLQNWPGVIIWVTSFSRIV